MSPMTTLPIPFRLRDALAPPISSTVPKIASGLNVTTNQNHDVRMGEGLRQLEFGKTLCNHG